MEKYNRLLHYQVSESIQSDDLLDNLVCEQQDLISK